jgi:hypothetical protein
MKYVLVSGGQSRILNIPQSDPDGNPGVISGIGKGVIGKFAVEQETTLRGGTVELTCLKLLRLVCC